MLVTIKVHSAFRNLFSDLEFKADINKYADIPYYLGSIHPRFAKYAKAIEQGVCQEGYAILDKNLKIVTDQELFIKSAKHDDEFYLTPAITGAGGKRMGTLLKFAAIAAAAYVGFGAITGTGIGGSLFGTAGGASAVGASGYTGATVGAEAGRTMAFSSTLAGGGGSAGLGISMGTLAVNAGLALVTSLFTQRSDIKETDQNIRTNDMFGSLQNTINSGTPIPLIYGMHRVPGQLISGYLDTVDHGKEDIITVASRFSS